MPAKFITNIKIALFSLMIALVVMGCDRYMIVKGQAFEWSNAPSGSRGYIELGNHNKIESEQFVPLGGVTVVLYHASNNVDVSPDFPVGWEKRSDSDISGRFDLSTVTSISHNTVLVKASKSGYLPVYRKYKDNEKGSGTLVIVLVKSEK